MNKFIIVFSLDEEYIHNLLKYADGIGISGYEFITFTEIDKLDEFHYENSIDIFITDVENIEKSYGSYNFVLTEVNSEDANSIYRYLPINKIFEKILLVTDTKVRSSSTKLSINSIFSASNQELKAKYLDKFFVGNMESKLIINLDTNIEVNGQESLESIIYFSNLDINKGIIKLNSIGTNVLGGVDYSLELNEVSLLEKVFEVVEKCGKFKELFIIFPEVIMSFLNIMEMSNSIQFITNNCTYDQKFLQKFEIKFPNLYKRIERVEI